MTELTITNEYGYVPCVENHNPVLSLFMIYNCKKTNMTGATSGAIRSFRVIIVNSRNAEGHLRICGYLIVI
jgi:hypothetical protein